MKAVELARDLIKEKTGKDGKCTLSKKKLAEVLHQRHPTVFESAERARDSVRRVTGSAGKIMRKQMVTRVEWKGFTLPEPEKNDYSKVILNDVRVGILSDVHLPYYEKSALHLAINYLKKWKPDCILLNGDIADCYQLSNWEKDPRKRSFSYEVDILQKLFIELLRLFPNTRIIYKLGNHEERYEKIILQRIPQFVDMEMFTFANVINAKKYGIEVVDNKRTIKAGKVNIVHGHELPRGIAAPVNPARGFYLKSKSNVIGGHHHQTSEHFESDINGEVTGAWSSGCLCELHPNYMPINKWNHGFITLENHKTDFTVRNLKIINGKVL